MKKIIYYCDFCQNQKDNVEQIGVMPKEEEKQSGASFFGIMMGLGSYGSKPENVAHICSDCKKKLIELLSTKQKVIKDL